MAKRCPLCGEKLKENYCDSCGYEVPDDEEISALYNMDPNDYPQPEREIFPEQYPEDTPLPDRLARGSTYRQDSNSTTGVNPAAGTPGPRRLIPEDTLGQFLKKYLLLLLFNLFLPMVGTFVTLPFWGRMNPKYRFIAELSIIASYILWIVLAAAR